TNWWPPYLSGPLPEHSQFARALAASLLTRYPSLLGGARSRRHSFAA
ncbi:hypothetical protein CSUI_005953, partial [Cystoisospora suis]